MQAFGKLSEGFEDLEKKADEFESKSVSGLLRGAPDLTPYIENLEKMFVPPKEKTGMLTSASSCSLYGSKPSVLVDDQLIPREGGDEAYDEVEAEIMDLEKQLNSALGKLIKKTG